MTLPPIRREIVVAADPAIAFEVFTEELTDWWPMADLSVYGEGSTVEFRDGAILESHHDQPTAKWGTVLTWDPPSRLSFTWHPGHSEASASEVTVSFAEVSPNRTRVTVEHVGWDVFDDPAAARAEYDHGWPHVLAGLLEHLELDASTWVVLSHAAADGVRDVFGDARFRDHVAFLTQLDEEGLLVAAGPLPDERGAGMTVVRAPGRDRFSEIVTRAETSDLSVVHGLLVVTAREWAVRFTG